MSVEWKNFPEFFARLGPPMRPSPQDVDNIRQAIAGHEDTVLLLGVTPEFTVLGKRLIALDGSQKMIDQIWLGDDARRKAHLGNWLAMPDVAGSPTAVVGDGSLNAVAGGMMQVMREVRRVMKPGGVAAFRMFCSPETPETPEQIRDDVYGGCDGDMNALKWRLNMALASTRSDAVVSVDETYRLFTALFPDRQEFAARTGWSEADISTIDSYLGANQPLMFPTVPAFLDMAAEVFEHSRVIEGHGYVLCERCPVVALW